MIQRKSHAGKQQRSSRRRGATAVLFALMLTLVMAFVAFSIDLGYVCSVKTDLQTAADSGALAGAGMLLEGDGVATDTALQYATTNLNNRGVQVGERNKIDVQTGHWDMNSRTFIREEGRANAVQVISSASSASLFFGSTMGRSSALSQARAVAAYRPRDIMLVLDVSGSMKESRNGISKIDEMRDAVREFVHYVRAAKGRDRIGFSYYSTTAELGMGLSYDLNVVEACLMKLLVPDGYTNISDGMLVAREELNRNRREQSAPLLIVLTDGAANTIQPENIQDVPEAKRRVIEQAELAKQDGIPVFTLAFDSLTAQVDVELMQQVADITGSESMHVIAGEKGPDGNRQLKDAFRRIAQSRPLRLVD